MSSSSVSGSGSSSCAAVEQAPLPERRTASREKLKTNGVGGGGGAGAGATAGDGCREESIMGRAGSPRARVKPNSAYVPHNRLSRYFTAISSLALVKFNRLLGSELPLDKIGLFSSSSFQWLNEYLYAGYKNGMKDKTLPTLSQRETCNVNGPRLEGLLRAHFVKKGQAGASIPRVAWEFVRTRVLIGSFLHLLGTLVSLVGPVFVLHELIVVTEERIQLRNIDPALANVSQNFSENSTAIRKDLRENEQRIVLDEMMIFAYTGVLALAEVVSQFLIAWASSLNLRTACRLRSACMAVSYKKLLRSSLRCSVGAQQTLTYFVPDSEVLHELVSLGPLLVSGPAVLVLVSAYAWMSLGHWAPAGVFVVVFLYSCLVVAAYFTKSFAARAIEYSLRRMSLVEELIGNIQLAKIALWDRHFQEKIKNARRRELAEMQFGGFSEGCGLSMVHMIPVFAVTSIMLVSLQFGTNILFVQYVPVLVLFLVNLKQCIRTSWMALSSISKGLAFLNKLKGVLILPEADRFVDKPIDRNFAIIINNGHFTWSKEGPHSKSSKRSSRFYVDGSNGGNVVDFNFPTSLVTTLSEIDFYVPKGKLVGIYGREASGKTSFLLSVLGQLRRVGGTVAIDGTCSYLASEPWLMDGTLRDNVLFGENFDSTRYYKAIRSSHLHTDISSLAEFDDTEVAAAGLGPAQRQKIGLARVVYAQRDINLLDEPLNDLSYLERLQLFEKCVLQMLADRTVIVASERIELLSRCHVVYVMQEGKIVASGTHDDLAQSNVEYAKLVKSHLRFNQQNNFKSSELSSSPSRLTPSSPKDFISSTASFDSIDHQNDDSHPLYSRGLDFPVLHSFSEGRPKTGPGVYLKYTGGWGVCSLLCLLSGLYAFSIAIAPVCIVHIGEKSTDEMTANVEKEGVDTLKVAGGVLATLIGFLIVCGVILTIAYNKTIFVAATRLHEYWIESLGSAKIPIFSPVTISLLLNIFSLNLQEVDLVLPRSFITVMINVGISFFSVVFLWKLSPWLVLPVLAFVVVAIILSIYIRGAVLSLHELKVSSATLVLNYIGNTVQGRATIQAFSKEKEFAKKYYKLFNENSTYDFMLFATRLWIEFRLKLLSVLVLSAVIFTSEILYQAEDAISKLSLAYLCAFQLCLGVLHSVGALNSVYTSLMAVNSVNHYMKNLPKEREGVARLSSVWPMDGSVEFRNVSLYDKEESSKKPLTFSITSGEKIAVISSQAESRIAFVTALFRFMELPSGEIFICGTSISQVPLETLRRSISFVPGNPRLFNGTIRHNLDPSEKMADQTLMMVLQKVYLWEKVSKLSEKLVSDSCNLFTIYEKILIFLARALLNDHTKIIVMEEPDIIGIEDRSEILELVLRDVFADYTVIRLSSQKIRSCHKLLYLDDDVEDFYSDRGSSTLSQLTGTTELFTAVPANVLADGYNSTENL